MIKKFANIKLVLGVAVFFYSNIAVSKVEEPNRLFQERPESGFFIGVDMPKGIKGFQKGHCGFRKLVLRICEIEECNKKHKAKGLCQKHYNKSRKTYQKQYQKQWRQKNKEHCAECGKQWRVDNKEHKTEWQRQWQKTPIGKASRKAVDHRRRAMTKDLIKETIQRVYEDNIAKYGRLTCYLCGKPIVFGDERLKDSLEHSTPLSREGTNDYDNLGIAHLRCNFKKHTMTLEEYNAVTALQKGKE